MRRYLRTLVIIVILVSLGTAALAVQEIKINDFERGEDTILGLKLGLAAASILRHKRRRIPKLGSSVANPLLTA